MTIPDSFVVMMDLHGTGTADVDITQYVTGVTAQMGITDPFAKVAATGSCSLTVNNPPDLLPFSPLGVTSPYYNNLLPKRAVSVLYYSSLSGWTAFTGFTKRFAPASGKNLEGNRFGTIECYDGMTPIQRAKIGTPLRLNAKGDPLVTTVLNTALNAPSASDTLTLNVNPANNDTVTVNGVVIKYVTSLSGAANEVLIGPRREDTGNNLVSLVNGAFGAGVTYGTGSTQPPNVTATVNPELPSRATMWHDQATVASGNANFINTNSGFAYDTYSNQFPAALNDTFTHSFFVQAGTYTFSVLGYEDNSRGQISWYIDNVLVVSGQDWYIAGFLANVVQTASVAVLGDGYHVLKGVASGKNAGSSGYYLGLTKYWLNKAID